MLPSWMSINWPDFFHNTFLYVIGLLTLPVKSLAVGTWNRLMHDIPHISGVYESKYAFRLKGGDTVYAQETIRVKKYGRWVRAVADMNVPIKKKWIIKGEIRGRYLFASVESATRKAVSGKGLILLKSIENGSELFGEMIWVDSKLDKVWRTPYMWKRLDKETNE